MPNEMKLQKISNVVLDALREDFENIEIIDVKVHNDMDFEGEDILRIEVIFKGSFRSVDTSMLSGAVRHIRPKLNNIGEMAFPLFSFISDQEIKRTRLATT